MSIEYRRDERERIVDARQRIARRHNGHGADHDIQRHGQRRRLGHQRTYQRRDKLCATTTAADEGMARRREGDHRRVFDRIAQGGCAEVGAVDLRRDGEGYGVADDDTAVAAIAERDGGSCGTAEGVG